MSHTLRDLLPIALIRTTHGLAFMDSLAKRLGLRRFSLIFSAALPVLAIIAIYFTLSGLIGVLTNPAVTARVRELGPASNLLLPGVNPYLPFVYGWLALFTAMLVHEYAHGITAMAHNIPVNSIGVVLFLFIPVGAFVEVDEHELKEADLRKSVSVLSAGPALNLFTAVIALGLLLLVTSSLYPVVDGLLVMETSLGSPAHNSGIRPGDIIVAVNGYAVTNLEDYYRIIEPIYRPGSNLTIRVVREGRPLEYSFILAPNPGNSTRGYIGIPRGVPLRDAAELYSSALTRFPSRDLMIYLIPPTLPSPSEVVPFSDALSKYYSSRTPLGTNFDKVANLLFWVWFVNFNIGTFNAIPFRPLDGGAALKIVSERLLAKMIGRKRADLVVSALAWFMAGLVITTIIIPYVAP